MTPGERAKAFVDEVLIPREVAAELGRLTEADHELIRREALARDVSGGRHAREHGGQGWTHVEWFEADPHRLQRARPRHGRAGRALPQARAAR